MQKEKPRFDFSGLIRAKKETRRLREEEAKRKRDQVRKFEALFEKYGVKKAYLFGSVHKGFPSPDSDIDLYVEKISAVDFWNLKRELEEIAECSVDLYCQLDDPVFTEKIKERGELIYES